VLGALAKALMVAMFVLFGDAVAADSFDVLLQHLQRANQSQNSASAIVYSTQGELPP
jgi:fucose permease